jgi:integrase
MATKLTDRTVRALVPPASGNRIEYDTEVKGFGARITAAGAISFILNYRTGGRERRITIGSHPDWSVTAAREKAKELKRRVDDGGDPMGDRHAERGAPTVADLAARYLQEHATRKRANSAEGDAILLRQHVVSKLGPLRVAAVRRSEVEALHREVTKTTPIRANRMLALLSKMFSLSIAWDMRPDNPCKGIAKNPENRRERFLTPAELGRLMSALAAHPRQSADAVRLLLLTGARRGEVLGATWDQFDLAAGVWVKPASATKQGRLHRIPLSVAAIQLLRDMQSKADGPALFPGRGRDAPQTTLKKFWAAICRDAGIQGVRLHDVRHSYASLLAGAGLSLPTIGALLGHSSPATTQRYAHLLDEPLRVATEKIGAIITAAGKVRSRGA